MILILQNCIKYKKIIICIIIFILILVFGLLNSRKFDLEKEYYKSQFIEIDLEELKSLEINKANFIVFLNMQQCITSNDFNDLLTQFVNDYKISIYNIIL